MDVEKLREILAALRGSEVTRLDWTNGQERLTILLGAVGARLLEMLNQAVSQRDGVPERLHRMCLIYETGDVEKIYHAT